MAKSFKKAMESALTQAVAWAPKIRKQQRRAGRLCDQLLGFSAEERTAVLRDGRLRQYRRRALVEEFLRRMRCAWFEDPSRAEELGRLATQVLEVTGPSLETTVGSVGWQDVSARLWAYRGNVDRILCRWDEARQCFLRAHAALDQGSGDAQLEAELLSLEASLLRDCKDFELALARLAQAKKVYASLQDDTRRGKILLKEAAIFFAMNCLEDALQLQLQACKLLDGATPPELPAAAWSNLADTFCRLGKQDMAARILDECTAIFHRCGPRSTVQLNRSWVRGLIARAQGKLIEAEARFEMTREGYQRLRDPYNEALVSLDLATVYAEQGRQKELIALVEEIWAALRSQNLKEEAAKALELLGTTARQRQVALEVVRAASEALRQHRIGVGGCLR
jgi:tetratricopeptide (TPR) repeat protein